MPFAISCQHVPTIRTSPYRSGMPRYRDQLLAIHKQTNLVRARNRAISQQHHQQPSRMRISHYLVQNLISSSPFSKLSCIINLLFSFQFRFVPVSFVCSNSFCFEIQVVMTLSFKEVFPWNLIQQSQHLKRGIQR